MGVKIKRAVKAGGPGFPGSNCETGPADVSMCAVFSKWTGCDAVKTDPFENVNIAENPNSKDTVDALSKLLKSGWQNIE